MTDLQLTSVLRKTKAGEMAIKVRDATLAPKSRMMLIMLDGKKPASEMLKLRPDPQEAMQLLGELVDNGFATLLNAMATVALPAAAVPAAGSSEPSVYDSVLDGHLVSLKGKSLGSHREFVKPTKYYLFYHTASWCGPCQKFTPSLVEFYNANQTGNDQFEIILVTHDSDEDAMEQYAAEKKMTWPHLKLSRVEKFNKEFKHPGRGIPNLVLTDTQGKILKTSYEGENYLGPAVVMNHLGTLLKK